MAGHNELGKLGEELAADFLKKAGYEILATNWVYLKAEIDIIAVKDNILAIVEVKTRSTLEFGLPQEFVKPSKIKNLVRAVDAYVEQNDIESEVRFDIISIHKNNNMFEIEHLVDAFYYF
ncbi:YraN family protein [Flavobacterium sp. MFBS3-15]|uniref:YraN family protein n=1 Tax=Flavobacterium sp. MFBS3-15 TaxID=2989816 RepID=UPI0022359E80|nr:YraN family protein [Flavobacterium sp. MFBS3-15]MCW4469283.1 YraN family protein [Flavobacterium sp. MFBS3-15]